MAFYLRYYNMLKKMNKGLLGLVDCLGSIRRTIRCSSFERSQHSGIYFSGILVTFWIFTDLDCHLWWRCL